MKETINTTNLAKVYGKTRAVDNLNISIKQGEIFGFIGLNGAGKTTTIRMLLGMVKPTSGQCYLQGKRVNPNNTNIWRHVGYIVETPYSYPELTVEENLEIVCQLRGVRDKNSSIRVMKKLDLIDYASTKVKHLSLGNSQRLGIAKAIIHKPEILILDEPTNGLDPAGTVKIRQLLTDLAIGAGVTVLVSSHKLDEIARIATNISIIHNGKIVKEVDKKQIRDQLKKVLLVNGENRNGIKSILNEAGHQVYDEGMGINGEYPPLQITNAAAINRPEKICTLLVHAGLPPTFLKVKQESLEGYFFRSIKDTTGGLG